MTAPALPAPPSGPAELPLARLLRQAREQQQQRADDKTLQLTAQIMAGDLWAGGRGWNGPSPQPGQGVNLKDAARVNGEIERTFVSRNLARDIVRRHRHGVAGREPLWSFTPRRELKKGEQLSATETAQASEYSAALTDWWDAAGVWPALLRALEQALSLGKGTVRLFVHAGNLDDITDGEGRAAKGIRSGLSLSEAARRVSLHAPNWDQAGVTRDLDGHVTGAYFTRKEDANRTRWEVQERGRDAAGQPITTVHPWATEQGTDAEPAIAYPVPDLLIYELALDPLLTDSVKRLLRMANKTLTMGSRNIDLGGFLERTILNAQMPGEWRKVAGADGKQVDKFFAESYFVGSGTTNFLSGKQLFARNDQGTLEPTGQFTTPSVQYKSADPFTPFADAFATAREMILDEASQLHVLITGDASASGVSRQQAVNDFTTSLEPTRIALEQLLRWLLETVWRLALHFTGRSAEAEQWRVRAQARLSVVQPTTSDMDAAIKLHEAGLISEESALGRVGIEDVEAERATRLAEGITPLIAMKLLEKAPSWIGVRALQLAFPVLGITDEQVQAHYEADVGGGGIDLGSNLLTDSTDLPDGADASA